MWSSAKAFCPPLSLVERCASDQLPGPDAHGALPVRMGKKRMFRFDVR